MSNLLRAWVLVELAGILLYLSTHLGKQTQFTRKLADWSASLSNRSQEFFSLVPVSAEQKGLGAPMLAELNRPGGSETGGSVVTDDRRSEAL